MTLPVSLKKAFDKAHEAFEKDWKYHLKVCEHECKDTEKQKDLFGVGYFCSSLSSRGVFASFLETARKELKKEICCCDGEACVRTLAGNIVLLCKDCKQCSMVDAVFGGERK